jgi:predicted nucleic acid-binding protein
VKVLVDSCIWSLALRRKKGPGGLSAKERLLVGTLAEAIQDGRVAMVGPVRQEVLSGIRHPEQFQKVRERLEAFADETIESRDYINAARLDNLCRKHGVQCGEVDMLLCAVAVRHGWQILTTDSALLRCMGVIKRESPGSNAARLGEETKK